MELFEFGWSAAGMTGPLVMGTIVTGANAAALLELAAQTNAPTVAGEYICGRPASNGTGSTGTLFQALNQSDAVSTTHFVQQAWATTQPTAPTVPLRRFGFPGAGVSNGVIWSWDLNELIIPANSQFVIWCVSGQSSWRGYAKIAEGG